MRNFDDFCMQNSYIATTIEIINAKIMHCAKKNMRVFFNSMCETAHRAALTLSLHVVN